MPHINVNGVNIFYTDQGNGDETIVFSHGLLWSHRMFQDQIDFLKSRFRVIAYDHRGQGQSEVKGPFDMDAISEDAAELIKELSDGPVHFAGLSMGGFVGMRLAARFPELIKSLILMETSANAEPIENISKYKTLNGFVKLIGIRTPIANKVIKIMFAESWLNDPLNSEKINFWKSELKANKKNVTGPVEGVIYRKGIEKELVRIACPTMVLVGDEDVATTPAKAKFIQMSIRKSKLHTIPGAGHSSCIEKPKEINRLIGDWLVQWS
ncbi:pimeloyl-ACP methyl ester carboxylesterase [Algoriphagus ratkowskyi]|uniref:Alpha/beta hydrolase n=1 Tax=Algoriphagus ratkowskyi TaxID=57028 RepID=A0A2W7QQ85_9BACT|nr:alpha/beta hydrolase [Algoriphagus ratkowskyi]PZX50708.1 pimeloyl-ACP methyl ester carboxylesterase [Algoriphagus ratkowskyi]TXD75801.1 alpha/beta hydrolase [Algoriphagus ratkowskyi]